MKHGNFSGLARKYSSSRPKYSDTVLKALISLVGKERMDIVDVGAGTGIWTRMMYNYDSDNSITAIEPNDDMRAQGKQDSKDTSIIWKEGSGENTNLNDESCDLVTMASSFHWTDFAKATNEFHRILRKNGRFIALWNPRDLSRSSLLQEIEDYLTVLKPDLKRVSSGRSGITEVLTEKLYDTKKFDDVIYIEGRHQVSISPESYIEAWRSVNDVQFQLGPENFERFIDFIREKLGDNEVVVTYLTRAWSAKKSIMPYEI